MEIYFDEKKKNLRLSCEVYLKEMIKKIFRKVQG
jgi:hypothetical protein